MKNSIFILFTILFGFIFIFDSAKAQQSSTWFDAGAAFESDWPGVPIELVIGGVDNKIPFVVRDSQNIKYIFVVDTLKKEIFIPGYSRENNFYFPVPGNLDSLNFIWSSIKFSPIKNGIEVEIEVNKDLILGYKINKLSSYTYKVEESFLAKRE